MGNEGAAGERILDVVPTQELGQPVGRLTRQWVDSLKEQIELLRDAKLALLTITNQGDWEDFDGKPYLTDSGVQNVAGPAGIEFGAPEIETEEDEDRIGKWVRYTCKLTGRWKAAGRAHGDVGVASSRDPFFAKKKQVMVPFEEIDLGHVKKKAVTNAQHRVLEKLLGIGGLSWEQLAPLKIFPPKDSVRFKGGERKAATGGGAWTREKKILWGMLLELHAGEEAEARKALFKLTDNPSKGYPGRNDPIELSDGAMKWLLPRIEAEYRKVMGEAFDQRKAEAAPPPASAGAPAPAAAGTVPPAKEPGGRG